MQSLLRANDNLLPILSGRFETGGHWSIHNSETPFRFRLMGFMDVESVGPIEVSMTIGYRDVCSAAAAQGLKRPRLLATGKIG